MGFILSGLESEDYDRSYSDRELLIRIIDYFWPYRRKMVLVAGALTLNAVTAAIGPVLISVALDMVEANPSTAIILFMSGAVMLLGSVAWGFNYVQQLFSAQVVGNVVLKLREDVFNSTIGHDMSFFDEHPSGKIVSRVTSDTQDFSDVVTLSTNLLSQVAMVLVLTVWLFSINVWLTLLLLSFAPIAVLHCPEFSPVGPAGNAGCQKDNSHHQRPDPGIDQRYCGCQEFPAGAGYLPDL
jgi:ATP-binding cassette subfamily B protein